MAMFSGTVINHGLTAGRCIPFAQMLWTKPNAFGVLLSNLRARLAAVVGRSF